MLAKKNFNLWNINQCLVHRCVLVIFCKTKTCHQAFFRNLAVFSGFLNWYWLYSLRRTNTCLTKSALHVCKKCSWSKALRTCIHLTNATGAAEACIDVWINSEILIGSCTHEAGWINRMSQIVTWAKICTSITLAANRCCTF